MTRGKAVQVGAADALFERPQHVFVGHFIGSPGMNFLPVQHAEGRLQLTGHWLPAPGARTLPAGPLQIGIRPEYLVRAEPGAPGALACQVLRVQDLGTSLMLTAEVAGQLLRARFDPDERLPGPGETVWLQVLGEHTCFYQNEELLA